MADSAFFCTLSHEGVLAVRGVDAGKFLQGQLTCNLNYLSDTRASLGARCTQKGRMQSSFRIVLEGDGVLMAMASAELPERIRASGLALLTTGTAAARLVSSILFGAIWAGFGREPAIAVFLVALAVAVVLAMAAITRLRGESVQPA